MNNYPIGNQVYPNKNKRLLKIMRVSLFFLLFSIMFSHASTSYSQSQKISLNLKSATIEQVCEMIEQSSIYSFVFSGNATKILNKRVNVKADDKTIDEILETILRNTDLEYKVIEEQVVVYEREEFKNENKFQDDTNKAYVKEIQQDANMTISGVVLDNEGLILPGANIYLKTDKSIGTVTKNDGNFNLTIPAKKCVLVFTFLGMNDFELEVQPNKKNDMLQIVLNPKQLELNEVVVTGIYEREKDSFTGSISRYSQEELKNIGNFNVIQSLKTLDPTFNLIENNQFGSDPNRLPDLEIRGKTSIVGLKEKYGEDPNQPLFILDGFETSLQVIVDLSMDRIESVTILKDAASTAIYGAKAANGVVVIETKRPERGKLRVSYNGSADLSFPDLTDYNLMNAREKLEFELKAGAFKSNLSTVEEDRMYRYYHFDQEIKRGVDTYWLAEPLRTGVNQRNNLYVEGGDQEMRYGIGINNNNIQGVMQNSFRNILGGNIDLMYRRGKVSFVNKFSLDHNNSRNPIVDFSEYSRANPYYRKHNLQGGVDKWLEYSESSQSQNVPNPLWNDALNSKDVAKSFSVRNNFSIDYRPTRYLSLRGRFGASKSVSDTEQFYSPDATRFDDVDILRKGSYSTNQSSSLSYQGDVSATYGQVFKEIHLVNIVLGASMNESTSVSKGFQAEGFPEGDFTTPAFSNSYPEGSKPSYRDSKRRNAGFFLNTGYSLDNKYMLDFNLRSDGTSIFGSNRLFSTTWSVGLAWNLHEEQFVKNILGKVNMLKIRGSVGNPGNQSFGAFNALTTYRFNNWLQNNFGTGLFIDQFGDPDLEWQKTLDKNIGLDLTILRNRLHLNFDYYDKRTDPLLASVGIPLSVGISSRLMNIGEQSERGFSGSVQYSILYRPEERVNWTASLSFRHGKAYYNKIGNRLDSYNRENITKNLTRYYDGASPTALWAVVSKGIDPATGREVFLNKNNELVYTHSYNDEVEVGDSRPKFEGVFGNTFYWKQFSANVYVRYSYGADMFNSTLYSKVENISKTEIQKNQDRRALYDRWQKIGDRTQFKGISLNEPTPMSSRFIQKNNYLSLESIRVGYELKSEWTKALHINYLQVNAYMNEIGRISTIKTERGIDYPFARSVSLSLNINF